MQQPPVYITWRITCLSSADAKALRDWLSSRITLDRVIMDTVHSAPDGNDRTDRVPHRLGDYFGDICVQPDVNTASFLITFRRHPQAGRFWKDLMVNLLQEIESRQPTASIAVHSKGETQPLGVGAGSS